GILSGGISRGRISEGRIAFTMRPAPPASMTADAAILRSARIVRVDDVAGLVLGRPQDHFALGVLELVDPVALDALELHRQATGLLPLTLVVEFDVADDRLEGGLAAELGELVVIGAAGAGHGLRD